MNSINEYIPPNLLRTQSYIANGMINPSFKPPKKDHFSSLINNKYCKQTSNKLKTKTNKNYINDVKNSKNYKKNSFKKTSQKKLLKKYINDKISEKTEIINNKNGDKHSRNTYLYNTKTEKFKNISENYLYSKTQHHNIKENKKKTSNGKENNKNALNIRNKRSNINKGISQNHEMNKSNGLHKSNTFVNNNINEEFFSKTIKGRNNNYDFANIINQTKLGIMTTKANMNQTRNEEFRKEINNIYNATYRSKVKPNPKNLNSGKVKHFIHKILSSNNDDYLDIKNLRNKNILLNKLTHYTKREKVDFKDTNKTQRGLLTIKNIIKRKTMLFSPKTSRNKINNKPINLFHNSYSNYKQYHDYLNNCSNNKNIKNNGISPILTEYNIKNNQKKDCSPDLLKIKISKSLSNVINSMREQRKTSKFIKDLNKSKKIGNNSNKQIKFTYSSNNNDDDFDEFYSPNKDKINIIQFNDKRKLNNNKNYFIKKNISSDNFRRYTKRKNDKINFNTLNIGINNFVNKYNDRKNFIMPANEAIN